MKVKRNLFVSKTALMLGLALLLSCSNGDTGAGSSAAINTSTVKSISNGLCDSFAILSDGSLWAWGCNYYGELGTGNTTGSTFSFSTRPVHIATDATWKAVSAGGTHVIAIKSDGTLWAWGYNGDFECGDNSTIDHSTPVEISSDTDWAVISSGNVFSLALKSDGTLYAWGISGYCCGTGSSTAITVPTKIGSSTWKAISAGSDHSLAIKSDGTLWAWGYNTYYQCGNGSTTTLPVPTEISTSTAWIAISAGDDYSLAINAGYLYSWGYNAYYQCGNGSTTNVTTPAKVGSLSGWTAVAGGKTSGGYSSLAINTGVIYSWGPSDDLQNGRKTINTATVPTAIDSVSNWSLISSGYNHSMAVTSGGTLYDWGDNQWGEIGTGANPSADIGTISEINF
jgi:hypothetical protein